MSPQLILRSLGKNAMNFVALDQERIGYGVKRIRALFGWMAVDLNRDTALMTVGGGDLDTEHHPVPDLFSLIPRQTRDGCEAEAGFEGRQLRRECWPRCRSRAKLMLITRSRRLFSRRSSSL